MMAPMNGMIGENHRRRAEQDCVRQADEQKSDSVQNAVTDGDQHLAAEKRDHIIIDGLQNENEFVFESGIFHRQIIRPLRVDALLFQKQVERVNRDQRQAHENAEPRRHPRERLSANNA